MSKVSLFAVSVAGLLMSGSLAFADPAQSMPAAPAASADLDAIVCHAGETPIGTRLPGPRVCHTQREWNQIRLDSQQQVQLMQNASGTPMAGSGK
jgi:hypothetical protein